MRLLAAINLVLAVCVCLTAMQVVPPFELGEPDVLFGVAAFAALVVSLTVSGFSGH